MNEKEFRLEVIGEILEMCLNKSVENNEELRKETVGLGNSLIRLFGFVSNYDKQEGLNMVINNEIKLCQKKLKNLSIILNNI